MASWRIRLSSLALSRKVADRKFCLARMCLAMSTLSKTDKAPNSRMFWKVRAIPSLVMWSGVGLSFLV